MFFYIDETSNEYSIGSYKTYNFTLTVSALPGKTKTT